MRLELKVRVVPVEPKSARLAQQFRALAVLTEDPGSILSPITPAPRDLTPSSGLCGYYMHVKHIK